MVAVSLSRRAKVALLGGLALLVVLVVTIWVGARPRKSVVQQLAEEGALVYADFEMVPLSSEEAILRALQIAPITTGAELARPQHVDGLRQHVASFLYHYYAASASSSDYGEWRSEQGDVLLPIGDMKADPLLPGIYEFLLGSPLSDEQNAERVFDKLWKAGREFGHGACQATSVTSTSKGLLMAFKHLTPDDRKPPTLDGEMGAQLWVGGISTRATNWWRPRTSLEQAVARDGGVLGGYLAAIVEFADGTRRPMLWSFHWDSGSQRWQLTNIFLFNFFDERVRPPDI